MASAETDVLSSDAGGAGCNGRRSGNSSRHLGTRCEHCRSVVCCALCVAGAFCSEETGGAA
eukprot:evm.model.scf_1998.2 EVM.evm.TU.scf_1998.2   scf_1998:22040-22771(-)